MTTVIQSLLHNADFASLAVTKIELSCKNSSLPLLHVFILHTVECQKRGSVHAHITISQLEHATYQYPLWSACDVSTFIADIISEYYLRPKIQVDNLTITKIACRCPYLPFCSFALKGNKLVLLLKMLTTMKL